MCFLPSLSAATHSVCCPQYFLALPLGHCGSAVSRCPGSADDALRDTAGSTCPCSLVEVETSALREEGLRATISRMIIGVSGARGSFSEEAARVYASKYAKLRTFELAYLISAENVLSSLEKRKIHAGIFPIEN